MPHMAGLRILDKHIFQNPTQQNKHQKNWTIHIIDWYNILLYLYYIVDFIILFLCAWVNIPDLPNSIYSHYSSTPQLIVEKF